MCYIANEALKNEVGSILLQITAGNGNFVFIIGEKACLLTR